jgi:two-component system, chemotaxis family, response regulator Rcp1
MALRAGEALPPAEVLMVEDSPGDARLIREAMRETGFRHHLHVVADGVEAMEYLERRGAHAHAPRPTLILLDLNMPKMDGREVLRRIKSSEELRRIPVVILSSSRADEDVITAYDRHANCYVRKPIDFAQYRDAVRAIEEFWFSAVELPPS